jgi:RHS repeat-associated protein
MTMKKMLHFFAAFLNITSAFAQSPDSTLRELPNQRTFFSKNYYNERDNTYIARISPSYVHYLAADGTFKDIDTNLRLDKSGAYYIIDNGLYNVAFTGNFSKGNWDVAYEVPRPVKEKFRDPGKSRPPVTRIRWKVLSYGYFDRQSNRYLILKNANAVTPVVSGNTIDYPEIFSGIDIRYICSNVSVKEEIVLSQFGRDNLPDPAQYGLSRTNAYFVVAMEFLLTPANINVFARRVGAKVPIKQGNTFFFDGDDLIDFEDADSTLQFFFPKDHAHAVGDSLSGFSSLISLQRYFYSDRGRDYILVGVPWNWIVAAPEGDLIIDPTTSVATSEDVWLENTSNFDQHSAGLLIGKAADPYPKKRTLIKFNIAGSGIPSSATVLNAQMKLYYYSAANGGSGSWVDRWMQAHQILVNWAEAQATRDNRLTGTPWNVQYVGLNDVDAKSAYESTVLFQSGQTGTWKAWNLTNLTQKWVNGTATNYGVVLWATNETTNGYDLRFHSSDAPPPNNANPPVLEVIYPTDAATKTVYFLKDHLGSIRATVLDSATAPVIGYDDYDPWGYPLTQRTKLIPNAYLQGASKNKFTGKERDEEFGLNWDHFGGRDYDWLIGRWPRVDPLWMKHPEVSPYAYVLNNPMRLVDPDGMQVDINDMRFLRDQALRQAGVSERDIKAFHQADVRTDLIGAGILTGGLAAFTAGPYVTAAILGNPVAVNKIGIGLAEALAPGAENLSVGQAIDAFKGFDFGGLAKKVGIEGVSGADLQRAVGGVFARSRGGEEGKEIISALRAPLAEKGIGVGQSVSGMAGSKFVQFIPDGKGNVTVIVQVQKGVGKWEEIGRATVKSDDLPSQQLGLDPTKRHSHHFTEQK